MEFAARWIGRRRDRVAGRDNATWWREFAEHIRDADHHRRDAVDLGV